VKKIANKTLPEEHRSTELSKWT